MHIYKYITLFLICWHFEGYPQKSVADHNGNTPVTYAHILLNNRIYTYTDENGTFKIDAKQKFDTITISHLSYETLSLGYADYLKNDTFC